MLDVRHVGPNGGKFVADGPYLMFTALWKSGTMQFGRGREGGEG